MKYIVNYAFLSMIFVFGMGTPEPAKASAFRVPGMWEYGPPLIAPKVRDNNPYRSQKEPSVVFYDGKWHVFMSVNPESNWEIEYCSFEKWEEADEAKRTLLKVSKSNYYGAPQVFYFRPHKKWYMVYQMGIPGADKMWVAYSTTDDIADPYSWTQAMPILDGGKDDPRKEGDLDYWIICDDQRAYLLLTSLNGKMWRLWTRLEDFSKGFQIASLHLRPRYSRPATHISSRGGINT